MTTESIVFIIFVIFTGAALMSTVALYTRQSLLVAYILIGCFLGPSGLGLVPNVAMARNAGAIGILFLLFLLGLDLKPQKFLHVLRKAVPVTVLSSIVFMLVGIGIGLLFELSWIGSTVVGVAMMFSSTIIGLKLLPTTVLHHRHIGEMMIGILLSQDLIAIIVLVVLSGMSNHGVSWVDFVELAVAFPLLLGVAFLFERFLLTPCIKRFDTTQEYIFLLAVGWCLGMSQLAHWMGLSEEVGAFVAGITLAASPIAMALVESLKPLRDFFLVIFFFSIGAGFNFSYLSKIMWPAMFLATFILFGKPLIFRWFLSQTHESKPMSQEIGTRLGQGSEFSLLLANLALNASIISTTTSYLIQATMIITFIASSYWVVMRYPTPMAFNNTMRKD